MSRSPRQAAVGFDLERGVLSSQAGLTLISRFCAKALKIAAPATVINSARFRKGELLPW
jgi:hypothetical protein